MLGATLPNKPSYKLRLQQNGEISRQVVDLINKGLVRKSLNPCACPSILAPKKDGKWRLYINSRSITKITIRYRFSMPRIEDLMDYLGESCVYSRLNLKLVYHQNRIRQWDEWKKLLRLMRDYING